MSARDDILLALMDARDRRKMIGEAEQASGQAAHKPRFVRPPDASAALSGYSRAISSSYTRPWPNASSRGSSR